MTSYATNVEGYQNQQNKETRVQISLFASKLKNVAGLGKGTSDPYAVVTILAGGPSEKPKVLGKTEVIKNDLSPAWTHIFETTYNFGKETKFNVGIFDEVRKTGKAIPMGSACFEIGEILGARGNIKAKKLRIGGTLFARVIKAVASNAGTLNAQFRGVKLKNVDGLFSKSDPFFVISSFTNDLGGRMWHPVYRSEAVQNDLNPVWKPFSISLEKLCDGDKDRQILIEVFDWEKSGKHQVMGNIQTTVNALLFLVGGSNRSLELKHKKRSYGYIQVDAASIVGASSPPPISTGDVAAKSSSNTSGGPPQKFIKINGISGINPEYKKWKAAHGGPPASAPSSNPASAPPPQQQYHETTSPSYGQSLGNPTLSEPPLPPPLAPPSMPSGYAAERPSFVDYIAGGTEINMVVAIDYTGSNGDPRVPGTLHHIHRDGQLNDYEKALTAVGSIVARYDSDQMFPVLGFGAKYGGIIRHCFQVGKDPELKGVAGMLKGYRGVFNTGLTMSGPTVFAEVIDYAAQLARSKQEANASVGEQSYTILLILTDGAVTDIEQTKAAVRNANTAPLSIVIIGVGNADFRAMRFLDDFHQQEGGRIRDIVQFVEFNKYKQDREALTRETLDEIPDQLVDYFYGNNIMPLPPSSGSSLNIESESFHGEQDIDLSFNIDAQGGIELANPAQATWDAHSYGNASRYLHHQSSLQSMNSYTSQPAQHQPPAYAPSGFGNTGAYSPYGPAPAGGNHAAHTTSAPPPMPSSMASTPVTVQVQAPGNAYPGMRLRIQHPKTGQFQVISVPPGVAPGQAFRVQV